MKITHLVLWVQDNTASEHFYKKVGFTVTQSTDETSTVKLGNFEIMLVTMRQDELFEHDAMVSNKGCGMYIYIYVDDTDKKYHELIQKGIQPASVPKNWDWGNREFIAKDPDGYKLCFWHNIP